MITQEVQDLFDYVRTSLGAPFIPIHLTDDQLCILFKYVIKDYQKEMANWLIVSQFQTMVGRNVLNTAEMAWSLTMRTLDFAKDFSHFFSKESGLQQHGPWELKKDFFVIERGKQSYTIPAGREINKVLHITPNVNQAALFAQAGGVIGMGGIGGMGMTQLGGGMGMAGGFAGAFVSPAYDTALLSSDLKFKQSMLGGERHYKVTRGPDGTNIIHLLSTPGSRLDFMFTGIGNGGVFGVLGCECWYTYYDVSPENVDDCRRDNPDVLLTPDQVPISETSYEFFNLPAKQTINQLLLAKAKETLGYIRGTYSGNVRIAGAELTLDYNMLLQSGREDYRMAIEEMRTRLELLRPERLMERQADLTKALLETFQGHPKPIFVH